MDVPDHRRLGRQLGIFTTDEACGAGLPLWLAAGAAVRTEIERFVVELERRHGYRHVNTPAMAKRELYERSGHWAHFHEDMYPPMDVGAEQVVLRPMLCPHHILIFAGEPRSLREMPFRVAEIGPMFRYERSGVVGGLSRVRQMTLNDGHVFCAPEHVEDEIADILAMVDEAYRALGIPPARLRLSRAGTGPKYATDARVWQESEAMIRAALQRLGADYTEAEGEAAFYGPKIDLQVSDPQGREETLSTVQVDLHLPGRFALQFRRGDAGEQPVMIHRSIVSTMERMVAHVLEVHDGALPVWLAPTQVVVLPVSIAAHAHAVRVRDALARVAVRAEIDDRDATLAARVRDAQKQRIPYVAVVGDREASSDTVAGRVRPGTQLPPMGVDALVGLVHDMATSRATGPLDAMSRAGCH
jgi:threonyl-tRNA synthetase